MKYHLGAGSTLLLTAETGTRGEQAQEHVAAILQKRPMAQRKPQTNIPMIMRRREAVTALLIMSDVLLVLEAEVLIARCLLTIGAYTKPYEDTHMNKIIAFVLVTGTVFFADLTPRVVSSANAQSITIDRDGMRGDRRARLINRSQAIGIARETGLAASDMTICQTCGYNGDSLKEMEMRPRIFPPIL